jgi:2-C-methyl-D-erythritol 4-phosphate cytidylyltransferase/2-C-methyl-D-erythritol 2,4-cyclodiphosphate synthase
VTTWAILVAAGDGARLGKGFPKALVEVADRPLFTFALASLIPQLDGAVVVGPEQHLELIRAELVASVTTAGRTCELRSVAGGPNRHMSVKAGLALIPQDATAILVHDAARPFIPSDLVARLLDALRDADAAVPGIKVTDTVKRIDGDRIVKTESREGLVTVETPQAFRANVLRAAHAIAPTATTDDAALVENSGGTVRFVELAERGLKVTVPEDLELVRRRLNPVIPVAFGTGDDVHALVEGRACMLGCIEVPHDRGPDGHSDGDPIAHAICDALLGAAQLGDLGSHFPSSDDKWKGASGAELLAETGRFVRLAGFEVGNVDATVLLQQPSIAPYRLGMRLAIASALGVEPDRVSVKATTTDHLGIVGSGDAVAAHAVVSLRAPGS